MGEVGTLEKYAGDEEADGENSNREQREEAKKDRVIYIDTSCKAPRSFKISKDDIFKHKGTIGCPGCSAVKMLSLIHISEPTRH
eukprot:3672220-Karenia_brevis.AAC.1